MQRTHVENGSPVLFQGLVRPHDHGLVFKMASTTMLSSTALTELHFAMMDLARSCHGPKICLTLRNAAEYPLEVWQRGHRLHANH